MSRAPYEYPGWVPPKPETGTQPSKGSVNRSSTARDINITSAAIGSPIPIAYGRVELAPLIFAAKVVGSNLIIGAAWCLGEIEEVEQIYDGDASITTAWVKQTYLGVAGQTVDPTLAGAITGYSDTLETTVRGETVTVAYSVLQIPVSADFPKLKAVIKGKRSWSGGATFWPPVNVSDTATTELTGTAYDSLGSVTGALTPAPAPEIADKDYGTYSSGLSLRSTQPAIWNLRFPVAETVSEIKFNIRTLREHYGYQLSYDYSVLVYDSTGAVTSVAYRRSYPDGTHSIALSPAQSISRVEFRLQGDGRAFQIGSNTVVLGVTCRLYELEVYAPRQSTYAYTANPAIVLSDLCASKVYGMGREIDPTSLQQTVDWCDETMPDSFPRNTVGIALLQRSDIQDHIEALRAYANCLVGSEGDKIFLIPNRPAPMSGELTEDDIVESTFSMEQVSTQDVPTVVSASFTDSSSWPWTDPEEIVYHPDVLTGTLDYRPQSLRMHGIYHVGQAQRLARQRLNHYTLVNLRVSLVAFDRAAEFSIGDVIEITHTWGLVAKQMRLIGKDAISAGRYRLDFEEYDPKVYSATIETTPSYPDTAFHPPDSPPDIAGLDAKQDGAGILRITFDKPMLYPYPHRYEVEVTDGGGATVHQKTIDSLATTAPGLAAGTYTVRARIVGEWTGAVYNGAWVTASGSIA